MRFEVLPYDPQWPKSFEYIKTNLENFLDGTSYKDIIHVGSTAIPGLYAKPIIDIDIVIRNETELMPVVTALVQKGPYEYYGENGIPGRYCVKHAADTIFPRHNLYILVEGSVALRNHLSVKEVLMKNDALREEYSVLKKQLAEKDFEKIGGYAIAKTVVLEKIFDQSTLLTEEEKVDIRVANQAALTHRPEIVALGSTPV
jgi:GrpB-like predicted nucleotidyltransferase (UPF0157 family)